jgi:hypothetical protein
MSLWRGMAGEGQVLRYYLPNPVNVSSGTPVEIDIMAASVRSLAVTFTFKDKSQKTFSAWSFGTSSPGVARAIYVPSASDFTVAGPAKAEFALTLDGVTYRYNPVIDEVE